MAVADADVCVAYAKVRELYSDKLPESLKPQQLTCLVKLLNSKNVFAVLPTGFGKSLVYGVFPLLKDEIESTSSPNSHTKSCAIIISPLISIMKNQVQIWRDRGIPSVHVTTKEKMTHEEIEGMPTLMLIINVILLHFSACVVNKNVFNFNIL